MPARWCRAAGGLVAQSGKVLPTAMHGICVYGDNPGAVANAQRLRTLLAAAGWRLTTLPEVLAS